MAWRRATAMESTVGSMPVTLRAEAGERLGDEPAAAADIEDGEPAQRL